MKKCRTNSEGCKSVRQVGLLLDSCDALPNHVLNLFRKRSIRQACGFALAMIEHPAEKVDQCFGLGCITVGWNEKPGEAGHRIRISTWSIRNRDAIVGGHVLGCTGSGGRNCVRAPLDELPGGVLHQTVRNLVLDRVDQLHVTERVGRLTNHAGNAFTSLLTYTCRPVDRRTSSRSRVPRRRDLGEEIGEDKGRSASLRPIYR